MKLKTVKGIYLIALGLGIIIALIGGAVLHDQAVIWTGGGILIADIIFHLIFYRCPHCRRYLFRNDGGSCPSCGKALFDGEE